MNKKYLFLLQEIVDNRDDFMVLKRKVEALSDDLEEQEERITNIVNQYDSIFKEMKK